MSTGDAPKAISADEAELLALVDTFTNLRTKLFNTTDMTPGTLNTALDAFRGLSVEQVGLLLAYAVSTKPGAPAGPPPVSQPLSGHAPHPHDTTVVIKKTHP
jgi:hypothetical protein